MNTAGRLAAGAAAAATTGQAGSTRYPQKGQTPVDNAVGEARRRPVCNEQRIEKWQAE